MSHGPDPPISLQFKVGFAVTTSVSEIPYCAAIEEQVSPVEITTYVLTQVGPEGIVDEDGAGGVVEEEGEGVVDGEGTQILVHCQISSQVKKSLLLLISAPLTPNLVPIESHVSPVVRTT